MKLFPSLNERLLTIAILAFVSGLVLGLVATVSKAELVTAALTLSATFLGAYYAFSLQSKKAKLEQLQQRKTQGNLAIFNISRIYNMFLCVRNQFIDPSRDSLGRHFEIQASYEFEKNFDFNYAELAFLFNSTVPNILGEINTLHNQVTSTIELINHRSAFHREQLQPKLESAGLVGDGYNLEEVEKVVGPRLTITMKTSTDDMVEAVDDIIERCETISKELNRVLVERLDETGIVSLIPVDNA